MAASRPGRKSCIAIMVTMDYPRYLDLLQNLLPSNTPPPDCELVVSPSVAPPLLPLTEREQLDLLVLAKLVAKKPDDKGLIVLCNSPCYVLYLLCALPVALDTSFLPYPLSAYLGMLQLYRTERQQLQSNLEYFAYAAKLYFMTLHHEQVFRDLDLGNSSKGTLTLLVNQRPLVDSLAIVTYDRLPLLLQHDTNELLWRAVDSLSLLRDFQLCDLSSPALPDFAFLSPERFVKHPNRVRALRYVSPDTHDYSNFAPWLNPHNLPPLSGSDGQGTSPSLLCLMFPASATLQSPLQQCYVHRELLSMTVDMTIGEYIVFSLTTLFLAADREFEIVVDCQWLRRQQLPLFDEQVGEQQTVLALFLRSLCSNLVVTIGMRDDQLLRVEQDTLRWSHVRQLAALHQDVLLQL